jgi:uncharacterized membrane protein
VRRRQAIAVLALAGLFVSLYLWLHKIGVIGVLQCGTGGCDTVQASPYSELFGRPVALYGVVGYSAVFVLGLAAVRQGSGWGRPDIAIAILAAPAFLFTLYLTALELLVIHAICRYCVVSALIVTAILGLAVAPLLRRR